MDGKPAGRICKVIKEREDFHVSCQSAFVTQGLWLLSREDLQKFDPLVVEYRAISTSISIEVGTDWRPWGRLGPWSSHYRTFGYSSLTVWWQSRFHIDSVGKRKALSESSIRPYYQELQTYAGACHCYMGSTLIEALAARNGFHHPIWVATIPWDMNLPWGTGKVILRAVERQG